jgi:predicted nicotinamide N-methyase
MKSMRRIAADPILTLATRRARLLSRIHRRFQTIAETHAIGPLRLCFTRVEDPDVVLDQIVEAEDRRERATGERRDGNELHLPYWAELWDSAVGMAGFLEKNFDKMTRGQRDKETWRQRDKGRESDSSLPVPLSPFPLVPPSILDLGCGMGFAGMTAAAMGARVVFADLESDALLFARLNSIAWSRRIRTRRLNWQRDRLDESFDLILGADVLYDRSQWEFLDPFFKAHLKKSGSVLLGEPGRQTGDWFPDWITQRGWTIAHFEQPVTTRPRPIRLFSLMLK